MRRLLALTLGLIVSEANAQTRQVDGASLSQTSALDKSRREACRALPRAQDRTLLFRGRLFAANGGGSGFRIWPVGSERLYWISAQLDPELPDSGLRQFKPFSEVLYGDFEVLPLAPDKPGHMREVCLITAKNVVVRTAQK
jgi:hypothetical protein